MHLYENIADKEERARRLKHCVREDYHSIRYQSLHAVKAFAKCVVPTLGMFYLAAQIEDPQLRTLQGDLLKLGLMYGVLSSAFYGVPVVRESIDYVNTTLKEINAYKRELKALEDAVKHDR